MENSVLNSIIILCFYSMRKSWMLNFDKMISVYLLQT